MISRTFGQIREGNIRERGQAMVITAVAFLAMLAFAAATQGFFLTKSRIWETVALIVVAFTLFRPGFWWDMAYPPLIEETPAKLEEMGKQEKADELRTELQSIQKKIQQIESKK